MTATIDQLLSATDTSATVIYGVTRPFAAYALAELTRKRLHGRTIAITPDEATARRLRDDVEFFLPPATVDEPNVASALHIPFIDTSPYAELRPDQGALMGRMSALHRLACGRANASPMVILSAISLIRKVMPRAEFDALSWELACDEDIDRDDTARRFLASGYARTTVVEDPGTFAVRGGVIDVFVPLYRYPIRIDLFGDTIETLRFFDPDSQRTLRDISHMHVHPVRETIRTRDADMRASILAAADRVTMPSSATRKLLEQLDSGEAFVGIETLTPAFHRELIPLWRYLSVFSTDGRDTPDKIRRRPHDRQPPLWLFVDPDGIAQSVDDELEIAESRYQARLDDGKLAFPPGDHYVTRAELDAFTSAITPRIEARTLEVINRGASGTDGELHLGEAPRAPGTALPSPTDTDAATTLRFYVDDNRSLRSDMERTRRVSADELMKPLVTAIRAWQQDEWRVVIAVGSLGRARQLHTLLSDYECAARVRDEPGTPPLSDLEPGAAPTIHIGRISSGFAVVADKLALVSDNDIFGERRRTSARQRAAAKRARKALMGGVADFSRLEAGDYVVHDMHGVGRYRGLAKLAAVRGGPEIDFLHLEYTGGTLYLPMVRLSEVHRYVGAEGHAVKLDRLGGITWQKTRKKVAEKVAVLADALLQIYAQRAVLPGFAFPASDGMFREFEATFPFEETPDQKRAIDEVLADMESQKPMERLVCGDVGYGKTEVAMRAMFKAALGGKQAALLAPTTVLVEQHYRNLRERFQGWPVEVAKLSRFQSKSERVATITGLAAGTIDMVVGTHRLLSKDVRFKDLGLLVIDEEQRFGVAHKEKMRRARTQIDALTLTATPIPRTLHLAMTGLRDLSIIATPPADRRAIRTFVAREDESVLREAIRRELGRGGQVFFVCPRIGGGRITGQTAKNQTGKQRKPSAKKTAFSQASTRSVYEWADYLQALVPSARPCVAHGQMSSQELEKAMVGFVNGDFDILISTTIIENGLDIPRANTMFIERADMFGLSQLYQLRGRIGRSKERAFCYLLVPPLEKLSTDARRRLQTLQRFTELGAGFQIASQDLEIRGGGELLGAKQSGSIAAVGFDTYVTMLDDAVARLRGSDSPARHRARPLELNVDVIGYIPDEYIPDPSQRLDLYKRLSDSESEDDIAHIMSEIADRYGTPPAEVEVLGQITILACFARKLRAQSLELTAKRLILGLSEDTRLPPEQMTALLDDKRFKLTPDMRLIRVLSAEEGRDATHSARQCLLDLLGYAT